MQINESSPVHVRAGRNFISSGTGFTVKQQERAWRARLTKDTVHAQGVTGNLKTQMNFKL